MRRARGFTLLELVVALALLAVLAALSFSGLSASARMWEGLESRTSRAHEMHQAAGFIRRQVEQARPLGFLGASDTLQFVAPVPAPLGAGGLHSFSIAVRDAAAGKEIVVSHERHQRGQWERFGEEVPDAVVIARGLRDADLAYLPPSRGATQAAWVSRWERPDALPQLIRLRLKADGRDADEWREWLMSPRLGTLRRER